MSEEGTVQLAHGGGGRAMARLLAEVIRPAFNDPELDRAHDGALLDLAGPVAFTTDSYVVRPLVFPGGDIGKLAINGTINDLAMCGARPLYVSVGLILEEGLPLTLLQRVLNSMAQAAAAAGVRLVTGDTKVVDRGKADGLFVNTAGIGQVVATSLIGPSSIRAGDVVLISGDIGRHGITVLAARENLGLEMALESDCAPLVEPVMALIEAGVQVRCLRDLTRGGLASAAVEIAEASALCIRLDEARVPLREDVASACELLGLDPWHVANEGRFLAIVAREDAPRALAVLRAFDVSAGSAIIGEVTSEPAGQVTARGPMGVARPVDMLSGEQLPRIC